MNNLQRVHYIICKNDGYDHEVLRGVLKYARQHAHWALTYAHGGIDSLNHQASWYFGNSAKRRFDGVLFRGSDLIATHPLLRRSRAVVETQARTDPPPFPCVSPDDCLAGAEAAKHFLQLGFRHFAACISSKKSYQQKRWDGFRQTLLQAGHDASLLDLSIKTSPAKGLPDRTDQLTKWLSRQPLPLALMFGWVPNDSRLVEACERARLRIPEDIAVIGVGTDHISGELNWPTLSTVQFNLVDIGFQSAALLHRLMRGEKGVPTVTLVPPIGIRARMSTNIASVADETVAVALRLIQESSPQPVPVDTLARRVGVSRRTLEMRFQRALQCSPGQVIRRQRVEFAKSQLRSPYDKLLSVAMACGYHSYGDFVKAFREVEGLSPSEYRERLSEKTALQQPAT